MQIDWKKVEVDVDPDWQEVATVIRSHVLRVWQRMDGYFYASLIGVKTKKRIVKGMKSENMSDAKCEAYSWADSVLPK